MGTKIRYYGLILLLWPLTLFADTQLLDNQKACYGTAKDACAYYDGTNLIVDPRDGAGIGLLCVANNYCLPDADGTAGYNLQTDGLGAVTWEEDGLGGTTRGTMTNALLCSYDLSNDEIDCVTSIPVTYPPGGSSGQIQYNNAGGFGGISTFSTDGTDLTLNGGDLTVEDDDLIVFGDSGTDQFSISRDSTANVGFLDPDYDNDNTGNWYVSASTLDSPLMEFENFNTGTGGKINTRYSWDNQTYMEQGAYTVAGSTHVCGLRMANTTNCLFTGMVNAGISAGMVMQNNDLDFLVLGRNIEIQAGTQISLLNSGNKRLFVDTTGQGTSSSGTLATSWTSTGKTATLQDVTGTIALIEQNNCHVQTAVFFAEESAALSTGVGGGRQFSYGNGNTGAHGVIQPCSGTVRAMSMQCEVSGAATGRVQMAKNGTAQGTGCEVDSPNTANGGDVDNDCSITFAANDKLTPITTTSDAATDGCVVTWWVVYD